MSRFLKFSPLVSYIFNKKETLRSLDTLIKELLNSLGASREHNFDYEIINLQLGRMGHLNGARGHYDSSTPIDKIIYGMVV